MLSLGPGTNTDPLITILNIYRNNTLRGLTLLIETIPSIYFLSKSYLIDEVIEGIQVAMIGKAITIPIATQITTKKGRIPLKIVFNETSGATALITKTLTPSGGVIAPVSPSIQIITPNQIGSYPREKTTGAVMGIVSTNRPNESIKQPPTI